MFQKNLVVWKQVKRAETNDTDYEVSEELSSVETSLLYTFHITIQEVSEELSSVETKITFGVV